MSGVDQSLDAARHQIIGQASGTAKATDPNCHRVFDRRGCAAGKRKRHIPAVAPGETLAQHACFGGATENKDSWHVVS